MHECSYLRQLTSFASSGMASLLFKRQCVDYDTQSNCYNSFWWTDTGLAIRYAIVVFLFLVIVLFLLFSYLHAQQRIKRGLPPLGYHRWLVTRRSHPRYNFQNPNAYYMGTNMPAQQPGPPPYNNWDVPPQYQPPIGASKAMANQNYGRNDSVAEPSRAAQASEVQYPAPAHPPPSAMREV